MSSHTSPWTERNFAVRRYLKWWAIPFGKKPGPAAHVDDVRKQVVARTWIIRNLKHIGIAVGKLVQVYCVPNDPPSHGIRCPRFSHAPDKRTVRSLREAATDYYEDNLWLPKTLQGMPLRGGNRGTVLLTYLLGVFIPTIYIHTHNVGIHKR